MYVRARIVLLGGLPMPRPKGQVNQAEKEGHQGQGGAPMRTAGPTSRGGVRIASVSQTAPSRAHALTSSTHCPCSDHSAA